MNRRSFLKRAGGAVLAVVAAPLYVPAERLDFGVPTGRLAVPTEAEMLKILGGEVVSERYVLRPRGGVDWANASGSDLFARALAEEGWVITPDRLPDWEERLGDRWAPPLTIEPMPISVTPPARVEAYDPAKHGHLTGPVYQYRRESALPGVAWRKWEA